MSILRYSLQWRHNGCDGVSNHQPHGCLLNRLFRRRSQKTSKLRVTGLCEGNSLVIDELPAQRARNAENISIWWRHHVINLFCGSNFFTSILQGCSNLPFQWRHSGRHGVPNYQSFDSLFSYLFTLISMKTSKLPALCERFPPVTGGFPSQRAGNAERVFIAWRHNAIAS